MRHGGFGREVREVREVLGGAADWRETGPRAWPILRHADRIKRTYQGALGGSEDAAVDGDAVNSLWDKRK